MSVTVPVMIEHTACLHSLKTEKDCTTRIEGEIEVVTLIDKQVVDAILQTSRLCYIADMACIVPDMADNLHTQYKGC